MQENAAPVVFDVNVAGFEPDVVARSKTTPVLLDFWAEWCGPCRTLGPILEKLAHEFGGAFVLGKVDTEAEQDLAYAFQVQGIPFCVLIVNGRPVDAFSGALPERDVRRFLESHGITPCAAEPSPAPVDPDTPAARLAAGLAAAARGDAATARERLEGIGEEEPERAAAQRIVDGLAALEAPLAPPGVPAAAGIVDARERLAAGDFEGAAEALLVSIGQDKSYASGNARRMLLLAFELMTLEADAEDRVGPLRRRLATLLF